MDRLSLLLRTQDPAELRQHGLAIDERGRLVSIYEARAAASRALGPTWRPSWPTFPSSPDAIGRPRRMARGTEPVGVDDPELS